MKIGYARVSTEDQSLNLQIDALEKHECHRIFQEKISGKSKERPELKKMLEMLREGDKVVIYKLDRLGRSTKDLIELSEHFEKNNIELVSIVDQIDTSTSMGRFFFKVMASLSELERDILSERTKAGLQAARRRGRLGGRPTVDKKKLETALKMYQSKQYTLREIEEVTNISSSTIYRALKKDKNR